MSKKRDYTHIKAQLDGKEADAYMCFICGKVDKSNHGHHIAYYNESGAPTIRNMITLCPDCHRLYHAGKIKLDISRF